MTVEHIYNEFFNRLHSGQVSNDLNSADVNVALLDASHSSNPASHAVFDDVNADEISSTTASAQGYSDGGQVISNFTITADSNNRNVDVDGDNVTWTNSTIDAGYAVVYHASPSNAVDQDLLMLVDFEGEQSSQDAEFSIEWDSAGIYQVNTNP